MTSVDIRDFYGNRHVRRRIEEYLGGGAGQPATCIYLAQPDGGWPELQSIRPPACLAELLDDGRDLSRSLWDRHSLIAHLDIEYVNFEFVDEPYLDPLRSFRLQGPVCAAAERLLADMGIKPLHIVSGRGHHYVWRVHQQSGAFHELQQFGRCSATLTGRYRRPGLPFGDGVPEPFGYAFAGLGLAMEYLAVCIRQAAAPGSALPVELTAVAVGPGERGREMISLDVSEYGDPLYLRVIRVPFSAYLKRIAGRHHVQNGVPLITTVMDSDTPLDTALAAMRSTKRASVLAARTDTRIPHCADGMMRLLGAYGTSRLRAFHDRFYSEAAHPPEAWPDTYDRYDSGQLPDCVARMIESPNDLLMKPAGIELVVRVLLALGWHPRHIAGLIRSRYERDYGWGEQWLTHDAATRADFYTRIFAGQFWTGVDDLVDFNCCSIREKGLCVSPTGGCGIDGMRTSLLERRRYGRLADRPVDRLFLPDEDL